MVPSPGSHSPRPARGQIVSAMYYEPGADIFEVWVHPDDTADLLAGGIRRVNGLPVSVIVVDRLAYADQLRICVVHPHSRGRRRVPKRAAEAVPC